MSDGPEFEEIQITAADVRKKKMLSALMFGAVLPGMAEALPELEDKRPAENGATEVAAEAAAGPETAPPTSPVRFVAQEGVVVAVENRVPAEYAAFARLFRKS
ncbi:hypothetical protein [Pseudoruegeria sp. HB172150]|uniref:hypothetical protein n=1 Tax=Pseudoruegeria sp. HB172150 TaxID=2721164 RepID=UPI001555645C|nr:hypothetical protein [Pseudoruegeria sp. HB172150]